MSKTKYSIITVNTEGLKDTIACVDSIYANTEDFELIIVDNDSKDGSRGYLNELSEVKGNIKLVFTNRRYTFSETNNFGIEVVDKESEYIVFLNNDTVVSKDWLKRMDAHFQNIPLSNIGAIGCVSSNSNGRQMVGTQNPDEWYEQNKGKWTHTGVLYGWCMMFKHDVIKKIGGFDERFENSHEDNDLCLRAQFAGYKLVIAWDVYIHHKGQATLRKFLKNKEYMQKGYENRERYFDKWYKDEQKKLVAVYRTNAGEWLERSLAQTSKFAESIIIHFCRAPKTFNVEIDGETLVLCRESYVDALKEKFPKILKVEWYDGKFQEDYERNWLLQEALKLQEHGLADWCISVDDDEIYEDKIINKIQKMINPRNPEIMGYWSLWRTIWKEELGKQYYRSDSTFGRFSNYRLFRLLPGQEIKSYTHPEGHHCGSAPILPPENLRWSNVRVKHMGYDTPEQRQKKFEFYEANDHFKRREDIGQDDYSHLISKDIKCEVYEENLGVSLIMMVKNEAETILTCLENVQDLVDEMVIVDTGSTDGTKEVVQQFAKYYAGKVKLLDYPWEDNYSTPRNYGKQFATCPWILMMDADERFNPQDIQAVFYGIETNNDFIMFHVVNWLEELRHGAKPKYASTEAVRLYRNYPELYYTGIIHETIDDALVALARKKKIKCERSQVMLHHYGYLKESKDVRKKMDYYEKLNNKQIYITDGRDARPYFNLALHWLNDGKEHEALEAFRKCLALDPRFWHASQQMAALNMKNAKSFLKDTVNTIPGKHPFKEQAVKVLNFLEENTFGSVKVV